jgi:hypothetical protein
MLISYPKQTPFVKKTDRVAPACFSVEYRMILNFLSVWKPISA